MASETTGTGCVYPLDTPPENLDPSEARALFRRNEYHDSTSRFCVGYDQANLVVLPASLADDFEEFCKLNYAAFPLLYRSKAGDSSASPLARDFDVKTDLPRYLVYSEGRLVEDTLDLSQFEQNWEDMVSFYIGCSTSFEAALRDRGIMSNDFGFSTPHSLHLSNVALKQVGSIDGPMMITMRPIKKVQLLETFLVTSQYPDAHGAPIHMGNPALMGVKDAPTIKDDEVPVFWGCGFGVTRIIPSIAPKLAFTHYVNTMFITDVKTMPKVIQDKINIVELSRRNQPFFASVLEKECIDVLINLEKVLLDDPGATYLFQDSDLLKAVLSLSHASRVAITIPARNEQKEDGLPGALCICQALLALGKEVVLISDQENIESCVSHMTTIQCFKTSVVVIPCSVGLEMWRDASPDNTPWDCLLSLESSPQIRTVDSVHDIFVMANSNPLVSTVAVRDVGSGCVRDVGGETTPVDFVVAASSTTWAGYAVSLGLLVVSKSPIHWRYRSRGVGDSQDFKIQDFIPNADQIRSLLKHMNVVGIAGNQLPLQDHLEKISQLTSCLQ